MYRRTKACFCEVVAMATSVQGMVTVHEVVRLVVFLSMCQHGLKGTLAASLLSCTVCSVVPTCCRGIEENGAMCSRGSAASALMLAWKRICNQFHGRFFVAAKFPSIGRARQARELGTKPPQSGVWICHSAAVV